MAFLVAMASLRPADPVDAAQRSGSGCVDGAKPLLSLFSGVRRCFGWSRLRCADDPVALTPLRDDESSSAGRWGALPIGADRNELADEERQKDELQAERTVTAEEKSNERENARAHPDDAVRDADVDCPALLPQQCVAHGPGPQDESVDRERCEVVGVPGVAETEERELVLLDRDEPDWIKERDDVEDPAEDADPRGEKLPARALVLGTSTCGASKGLESAALTRGG